MRSILSLILLVFLLFLCINCVKKSSPPTINTVPISNIEQTSAKSGGIIIDDGGSEIISQGVYWSTDPTVTLYDNIILDAGKSGSFECVIKGMKPGTIYFVTAFATNSSGTSYGLTQSFSTLPGTLPVIATHDISGITQNSALSGGLISTDGADSIISKGVCWSKSPGPTILDQFTKDGSGSENFESKVSGLSGNTTYFLRAYSINNIGVAYGNQVSFKTSPVLPDLTTIDVGGITATSCGTTSKMASDGGAPVTACGVCWSTSPNPTISDNKTNEGAGSSQINSKIEGLSKSTTYYIRPYAVNSVGVGYGQEKSFTTLNGIPVLITEKIAASSPVSAKFFTKVVTDGGYGISMCGICISTNPNPSVANEKSYDGGASYAYTSEIGGLSLGVTYYIRPYATNLEGTFYGPEKSFTIYLNSPGSPVTDADGNTYNTVKIGTQEWLAENLKTTKFNDGTIIPNTINSDDWYKLTSPAYCWYNNDPISFKTPYGALYNWYTVATGKICPAGWHVPSISEWNDLRKFAFGVSSDKLGNLKEAGTAHWWPPNTGATNTTGFSAIPVDEKSIGKAGYWWSSDADERYLNPSDPNIYKYCRGCAYYFKLVYNSNIDSDTGWSTYRSDAMSVRCIKN